MFSVLLLLAATVLLSKMREAALSEAYAQAEQFVVNAQVGLNRALASIDALLGNLGELPVPATNARRDGGLAARLDVARQQNPAVRRLVLLDEGGRVVGVAPAASLSATALPWSQEYLGELRTFGPSRLVVGAAQRIDAQLRVVHVGRVLAGPDGRRLLAIAEIVLQPRVQALAPGTDLPGLETTLERVSPGRVLISEPAQETGAPYRAMPERSDNADPDEDARRWDRPARVSGQPALVVWRALAYPDLRLTASVRREDVLRRWRIDRNVVSATVAVFIVSLLAVTDVALRHVGRLVATQRDLQRTRSLEQRALEAMDCGFLLLDPQRRVIQWNRRFVELFPAPGQHIAPGVPLVALLKVGLRKRFPALPEESIAAIWQRRFQHQGSSERELLLPDGRSLQVRERPTPDGGRVITYHDVSDLRRAALAVEQLVLSDALAYRPEQRLELLDAMNCGVLLLDGQDQVTQWNRQFTALFPSLRPRLRPQVAARDLFQAWLRDSFPEMPDEGVRAILDARFGPRRREVREVELADGRRLRVREQSLPDGSRIMTFHTAEDMRQTTETIERLVFRDPLTNLPNRRLLMERLHQAQLVHAESGRWGALLYVDLDHFATINDALGNAAGDRVLKDVASLLGTVARPIDTVARLNGDEFVLMMPELASDRTEATVMARRAAEAVLAALAQPGAAGEPQHRRTASIGVALIGGQATSPPETITQAGVAMHQAKARGRSMACFFDPEMQQAIARRASLEVDLQQAVDQGEFELHYQPQCRLDGTLVGVEALLRWRHRQRGTIPPAEFIAVAEDSGLIAPIGLWCLREASRQLAAWQRQAGWAHLSMSVNVCASQLRHADFAAQVDGVLADTGAPADLLKLELTESVLLENVGDSVAKLAQLRARGVRIALDDFGTGHSSLSYLAQLPLDQLKIDQSFVRQLGDRYEDDVLVQTIVALAHTLRLEVMAEGVETPAQSRRLGEVGCTLAQGWLFGRPMPIEGLREWVQARAA